MKKNPYNILRKKEEARLHSISHQNHGFEATSTENGNVCHSTNIHFFHLLVCLCGFLSNSLLFSTSWHLLDSKKVFTHTKMLKKLSGISGIFWLLLEFHYDYISYNCLISTSYKELILFFFLHIGLCCLATNKTPITFLLTISKKFKKCAIQIKYEVYFYILNTEGVNIFWFHKSKNNVNFTIEICFKTIYSSVGWSL